MKFLHEAVCLSCGTTANDDHGFLMIQRVECTICGSIDRQYPRLMLSYNGPVGGTMIIETEERKKSKPLGRETSGSSFSISLNKWVWRNVEIDRRRDKYREIVLDPESGKIIHFCEEPLSMHRGHGTAKTKRRKPDGA